MWFSPQWTNARLTSVSLQPQRDLVEEYNGACGRCSSIRMPEWALRRLSHQKTHVNPNVCILLDPRRTERRLAWTYMWMCNRTEEFTASPSNGFCRNLSCRPGHRRPSAKDKLKWAPSHYSPAPAQSNILRSKCIRFLKSSSAVLGSTYLRLFDRLVSMQ